MNVTRFGPHGFDYALHARISAFGRQVRKECADDLNRDHSAPRLCIDCKHSSKRESDGVLMCGKTASLVDGSPVDTCNDMRYPTFLISSIWAGKDTAQSACFSSGQWWEPKEQTGTEGA